MKIVCTHCQAGYQVDLPEIKPGGVEFKCAKCEQKFIVKPQDHAKVRERLKDLIHVTFEFDTGGSRIVVFEPEGSE